MRNGIPFDRNARGPLLVVLAVSVFVAVVSAKQYAGCWYDGSRLAMVDSLVDRHTLAIDDSIWVTVPKDTGRPTPYADWDAALMRTGTLDKLYIDGHFYSDKSPVPGLLMAGTYQVLQWTTGLVAEQQADAFSYWMTVLSSGVSFVVAVLCVFALGRKVGLTPNWSAALALSLALATVAPVYSRHVNNHIVLLAAGAAVMWLAECLRQRLAEGEMPLGLIALLGCVVGLGYSIDLGAGPVLIFCATLLVAFRVRRVVPVAVFLLAAAPWLLAHHGMNYVIAGTIKPANAVPAYLEYPGSAFNSTNMTGVWNHSLTHFPRYTLAMMIGQRGFVLHQLPLFLAVVGAGILLWRRRAETPELLFAGAWCGMTWLLYAAASTNYSGQACSVRWFVPLLAPAYYVLALLLRERPTFRRDFLALSVGSVPFVVILWLYGPWHPHPIRWWWPVLVAGVLPWAVLCGWPRLRQMLASAPSLTAAPVRQRKAA